ncbi:MAG: carboxypeptidase M32 [Candidatus Competibacterales bacterium]
MTTTEQHLQRLTEHLRTAADLSTVGSLLYWDQATHLPPKGATVRGRQLALLERLAHEHFTDPAVGQWLDVLEPWCETLSPDAFPRLLVDATRRAYERIRHIPAAFAAEEAAHYAACYDAWTRARPADDVQAVLPLLEKTLDLSRRRAAFFPDCDHPMDPLIDAADPEMTVAELKPLFAALREPLVRLVQAIQTAPPVDDACLRQTFPETEQRAFGEGLIRALGYDFDRGRQDKTPHPFAVRLGVDDIRITTRFDPNDLRDGLFSTIHEMGHALYEQGIDPRFDATPLGHGASAGVHESQSRLWENLVGRSLDFWRAWYPILQDRFPQQLGGVPLETFYRAINRVTPGLIRTDADEVTYNLHVMIRFELELELLEGRLAVADLPKAWRERYRQYLGVQSPDHRHGFLQDVHWISGPIGGAFQSYTLGNVLAVQIYQKALADDGTMGDELQQGRTTALHCWLKDNLYRLGNAYPAFDLIRRATGSELDPQPYLHYLYAKFGPLYDLDLAPPSTVTATEKV